MLPIIHVLVGLVDLEVVPLFLLVRVEVRWLQLLKVLVALAGSCEGLVQ